MLTVSLSFKWINTKNKHAKGLFTRNVFLSPHPLLPRLLNVFFYCHQNNGEKMGRSPILSIIHSVTIGTLLSFNGGKNCDVKV